MQDAEPDAVEERSGRRELELQLAQERGARRTRHMRAEGREQSEAAVDGRRAAKGDEHVARTLGQGAAQEVAEAGGARAARVALGRREQRQADSLGGLDQERPLPAVADRRATRATERIVRIQLDPAGRPRRAHDRERPLAAVGQRAGQRDASGATHAGGECLGRLEGVERSAQLVGRAHDARPAIGAHSPNTARSRSSREPSTRSASTSRTPGEGTATTYIPAARAEARPGGESSNATASPTGTSSASQAAR